MPSSGDLGRKHLSEVVRSTVEETLNAMLDAEADQLCKAKRYEHSPDRVDTRAGHYERQLHTQAGEVTLKAGDTLIESGTLHAWTNPFDEPCRFLAVVIGADNDLM